MWTWPIRRSRPNKLAGVENVPALSDLFDWLVEIEKSIPVPAEYFERVKNELGQRPAGWN